MRILFAYPHAAFLRDYERSYLPMVYNELGQNGLESKFIVERDPNRADIIILLQSAEYKTVDYIRVLESDPLVRNHADRIFVIDYDDHPEGMLPGLYTSIEPPFFNPQLHRSWPILFMNNPMVYDLNCDEVLAFNPTLLFSFVGACSHAFRGHLFTLFSTPSQEYHVEEIKKFYNHNDDDRRRFVNLALDSVFCLCPRGYASYSNRICEVMAMARVPVIIADDWVPFSFGQDIPYCIKVLEKDIEHLPDILAGRRAEAEELRRNARNLWEKHCSQKRRVVAAVESIATLADQLVSRPTYASYRELWNSKDFLLRCGWTLRQRVSLRLKQHFPRLCSRPRPKAVLG